MAHGLNGTMIIPIVVLLLLVVSLFTKLPGATKRAGILVGLVVLQVFLGIFSHELPYAIMLHALNAFLIFSVAALTANRLRLTGSLDNTAAPADRTAVPV
jgi:heme A synthase